MRYYYGQLSRPLQGVYDALLGGFRALAPGIRIPMLDEKQLADAYLRLMLDEPTSGLDPVSRDELLDTFLTLCEQEGVSHMELQPE